MRPVSINFLEPQTQKNHGFSLTEAAIVLAVAGLVIGGIWIAAAAVSRNHQINQTQTGILKIVQHIAQEGQNNPLFTPLNYLIYNGDSIRPAGWNSATEPPLENSSFSAQSSSPISSSIVNARYYFVLSLTSTDACIRLGKAFEGLIGSTFADVKIVDVDESEAPDRTEVCQSAYTPPYRIILATN